MKNNSPDDMTPDLFMDNRLKPNELRKSFQPSEIPFETTDEISPSAFRFHQPRAEQALEIGLKMKKGGHVFVCGPSATTSKAIVKDALRKYAALHADLRDYLSGCPPKEAGFPILLCLPAGESRLFLEDIESTIETCQQRIRLQLLPRMIRSNRPFDETYLTAWTEELKDLLEERFRPLEEKYEGKLISDYFKILKKALTGKMKRTLDLASISMLKKEKEPGLEKIMTETDRLSIYNPSVVYESIVGQTPVVFEPSPTLTNLFGYVIETGSDTSAPLLFQPGSLLKAQGGFLALDFEEMILEPEVWKHLKRVIINEQFELPFSAQSPGTPVAFQKPEPLPLKTKLIVWGDERFYQEFYEGDPAFRNIFKIRADMNSQMDLNRENIKTYFTLIKNCCQEEALPPFHCSGVAAFLEAGVELAGRQEKLSIQWEILTDLIRESAYHAEQEQAKTVQATHVAQALKAKRFRLNLPEELVQEFIQEGSVTIQTVGQEIGQVNGIALYETEDYIFGKPCRITAQAGMGRSGVINIEREANLSGKTHDKGILILCGYLRDRFAQNKPLTLSISLCIEQFYSDIDGDSASLAETTALLSRLAQTPLQQGIAVTGSISQRGEVQAIGCVNEKITGFFDVCLYRGLSGRQGVIIPKANKIDLNLPQRVIQAVEKGDFHIFSVETIEETMEILTGLKTGQPDDSGWYPKDTLYRLIDDRLQELTRGLRDFAGEGEEPLEEEE